MNQEQPFKPEQRKPLRGLPKCPFYGTGYVTAIGEATPWIGVCGDNDGFRQRYKCTKD
jgi:hypothetical protein